MATEHDGNATLTPGAGLIESLLGGVLGRFGGGRGDAATGRAEASVDGRSGGSRADAAPDRLLTPEEHIVDAVERSGGTMKQSEIVTTVDWSESTVSRKLADLESREAVSRYQIGREKLVCLSGHEPAAVESPLGRAETD